MVHAMLDTLPWLIAMIVLIAGSAFFSASEAALFSLRWQDRNTMLGGGPAQRMAAQLLTDPDRLLSAVLLWNLAINMTYFGISSIVSLRFETEAGRSSAVLFSITTLLTLIFLSEMTPKSVAVLNARGVSRLVALPLALCVRLVDPIMPSLRVISLLSRRLIWPGFQAEPYLELTDLERAIDLTSETASLARLEQTALRNIVRMSDIRVEEWMRPRTQFMAFRPPVSLADLRGEMTPSGYLFVTEEDSEEVAGAINLMRLVQVTDEHLEQHAQSVVCVPWCATMADALQRMQSQQREVAAVVNEFGETIGILTFTDILDVIFHENPSRSDRLLDRDPIEQVDSQEWRINGMTSLRRLRRYFGISLPASKSVTVHGIIQEILQRLARVDDEVDWGPFHFRVVEIPRRGELEIEMTRRSLEDS